METHTAVERHIRGEVKTGVMVAISHGTPRINGSHKKLGRGKEGSFLKAFRGSMALLIP